MHWRDLTSGRSGWTNLQLAGDLMLNSNQKIWLCICSVFKKVRQKVKPVMNSNNVLPQLLIPYPQKSEK